MFFLILSRAISIIDYESARSRRKSSVGKRSQAAASCAQHPSSRRALSVYCVLCLVTQLCPILHNPMGCSLPGYSAHGDSPGKNTGVRCHALLQGIFPAQGPHRRWILYHLSHQGRLFTPSNGICCLLDLFPTVSNIFQL